jgi:phage terminase large subunit
LDSTKQQFPPWAECLFRPKRYKAIRGGRGSSKSWSVGRALALKASRRPLRILCTREFQNSISESCLELLGSQIKAMGLAHKFEVLTQGIRGVNGSEFIFVGVGSNPEKVMSMEGIDIAWCEQAERMSARSWEILIPTVRRPGSEIWVTFNPDEENDPTYQRFVVDPPPDCISLEVNWQDNPWFPEELRAEKDWLYRVDPEAAANVWGGECRRNASAQILRGKYVVESFAVPEDDFFRREAGWDGPYFGADWGFSSDPTVLTKSWIRGAKRGSSRGTLCVEHEAYGVGVEIVRTPALFDKIPGARQHLIRADNARPETINHVRNDGFRIEPCEKWKGSVEDGIAVLKSFEGIIIHPRCVHTAQEARLWSYRRDRLSGDVLPDVAPGNDHCFDSIRYGLGPMIKTTNTLEVWRRLCG